MIAFDLLISPCLLMITTESQEKDRLQDTQILLLLFFVPYSIHISSLFLFGLFFDSRESRGNRIITLHLLYIKFLYCNVLQKAEMSLAF